MDDNDEAEMTLASKLTFTMHAFYFIHRVWRKLHLGVWGIPRVFTAFVLPSSIYFVALFYPEIFPNNSNDNAKRLAKYPKVTFSAINFESARGYSWTRATLIGTHDIYCTIKRRKRSQLNAIRLYITIPKNDIDSLGAMAQGTEVLFLKLRRSKLISLKGSASG